MTQRKSLASVEPLEPLPLVTNKAKRIFGQIIRPFRPVLVAAELLHPSARSTLRQRVLFAGFCAWTVSPSEADLRREAMRLAARSYYSAACEKLALFPEQIGTKKDIAERTKSLRTFKKAVFDPLGGWKEFDDAISRAELVVRLKKATNAVQ
jgi:hypothetical protein